MGAVTEDIYYKRPNTHMQKKNETVVCGYTLCRHAQHLKEDRNSPQQIIHEWGTCCFLGQVTLNDV